MTTWIILGMGLANERWPYIVTSSLIGWAHPTNDPWTSESDGLGALTNLSTASEVFTLCVL